ncbi:Cytochrome c oxidase caa3 assembly factor (Caa3_CtaG) [Actinopolymorpha singaporensis]|uniref:Cytochrome c oxidase caa3 assembly factor (Caa3_CtaG) n=1 Tax=Actinopolymorpha singaporensis TaxID=117157 RepID=A0A1H1RJ87_9ACTN|nr:Cytochrome c oxidase caa3 assembly factor (Caa3_CtaG) [Actinopolymorpha singaporensis]
MTYVLLVCSRRSSDWVSSRFSMVSRISPTGSGGARTGCARPPAVCCWAGCRCPAGVHRRHGHAQAARGPLARRSPIFDAAMSNWAGHTLMLVHFLAVGLIFFWPILGVDPGPHRVSHPIRLAELFVGVPFHAVFGIAVMMSSTLICRLLRASAFCLGSLAAAGPLHRWRHRVGVHRGAHRARPGGGVPRLVAQRPTPGTAHRPSSRSRRRRQVGGVQRAPAKPRPPFTARPLTKRGVERARTLPWRSVPLLSQ